jgi:type IX secretion system PorP/SprF family membrane protein
MNKTFTISLLLLCFHSLSAQDIRFAQYEFTPQVTNAASIGTDDYMAGYVDYRTEKVNKDLTYKTTSVFGKYPFFNKQGKRFLALGLGFISDKSEGLGDLNQYGLSTTIAYNHYIGDMWAISGGIGAAYTRKEFTIDNYSTGSQWVNNVGFVPDAINGEDFQSLNTSYLSANGGIEIYQFDKSGDVKHYLGVSVFHFNEPDQSFFESKEPKPIRYSLQAGIRAYDGNKFAVGPEVIFNDQASSRMLGIGANITYHLEDKNPYDPIKKGSINLKLRNIVDEVIILGIQLNQPNFSIGFSYDLGLSSDANNPSTNATEFTFAIKKRLFAKAQKPAKVVTNYSVKEIKEFYKKDTDIKDTVSAQPEKGVQQTGGAEPVDYSNDGELQFQLKREFSFGFNESRLDKEDKLYLDDLSNLMKLNPQLAIEVIGHADNLGSESANKKVSIQRAKAVEEYLISKNIDSKRIKAIGKGSKEPLAPNDSDANRAKNRRVEFAIYRK